MDSLRIGPGDKDPSAGSFVGGAGSPGRGMGKRDPGKKAASRGWAGNTAHPIGDWKLTLRFGNSRKQSLLCPGSPGSSLGSTRSTHRTAFSCLPGYDLL